MEELKDLQQKEMKHKLQFHPNLRLREPMLASLKALNLKVHT